MIADLEATLGREDDERPIVLGEPEEGTKVGSATESAPLPDVPN